MNYIKIKLSELCYVTLRIKMSILCLLIFLLTDVTNLKMSVLVESATFPLSLLTNIPPYTVDVSGVEGDCINQNMGMIVLDMDIYWLDTICGAQMLRINWTDSKERNLLSYVRRTCNGLQKCTLYDTRILTQLNKINCRNDRVKPKLYDIQYECHPVEADNKLVINLAERISHTVNYKSTEAFYLALQPQRFESDLNCLLKFTEAYMSVKILSYGGDTHLHITCNGNLTTITDAKELEHIYCQRAYNMTFTTAASSSLTLIQLTPTGRDTEVNIECNKLRGTTTTTGTLEDSQTTKMLAVTSKRNTEMTTLTKPLTATNSTTTPYVTELSVETSTATDLIETTITPYTTTSTGNITADSTALIHPERIALICVTVIAAVSIVIIVIVCVIFICRPYFRKWCKRKDNDADAYDVAFNSNGTGTIQEDEHQYERVVNEPATSEEVLSDYLEILN